MAGRKRGSVVVRGKSISVVVDRGEQPWRHCPTPRCAGSTFTDKQGELACERCGAQLEPAKLQRRREWHSGFATTGAANRKLAELLTDIDRGTHVAPSALTLRAFYDETWLPGIESSDLRPTTVDLYRRTAANYIVPHLGALRLRDISPAHLVRWLGTLKADGVGARTVELTGTTAHKILASAVDLELIYRNPCDNREVRRARGVAKAPKPVTWSPEQTRDFLDSQQGERLYPLWRLAAASGLRRGELAGLAWGALDLEHGQLTVSATRVVVGWEVVASGPKTDNSARTIGLDAATVAALRQLKARQREELFAFGRRQGDDTLAFLDEAGRPYHPTYLTRTFATRARAAGLPPIRLHALRHGHATHGLESGVPLAVMSKRLGHASIRITADTYSHVTPAVDQAAADQVAALIDGAADQRPR